MPIINSDTTGASVITPSAGKTTLFTDTGLAYLKQSSGTIVPLGGSVSNVSVVTANGVSGSVANPTTAPAITLTLGAITPSSVSTSGNFTMTGLATDFLADFSNATISNRVMFQTSTVNGSTSLGSVPNGTSTSSDQTAYSSNTGLNASLISMGISNSNADIISGITGSGTYRPLQISTGGSVRATMTTAGLFGLGIVPAIADFEVGKNAATSIVQRSSTATASSSGNYALNRSRGTNAAPTAISIGDTIGVVAFAGYGTSYQNSANITSSATETFSGTVGGTKIAINTITQGGVVSTEKFAINGLGNVNLQATGADISNVSSQNGGQLAGFRNRIINGAMQIDDRSQGTAVTPTGSVYVIDRWLYGTTQASKITLQQVFDAPAGFYVSLKSLVAAQFTAAATDNFHAVQVIEQVNVVDLEFGLATAKPVTLSFWVKASTAGTYSGSLRNQPATRSYAFSFPVTTSWSKVSVTIPGDTTGTWAVPSATGTSLTFNLGSGSNYLTTANSWQAGNYLGVTGTSNFVGQANGSTFNFTGVQLELGSTATPYEMRTAGVEFLLCQRYFERLGYMRFDLYANTTGSDMFFPVALKVRKRSDAVTVFASSVTTSWTGVSYASSNKDFVNISSTGVGAGGDTNYSWLNCTVDAEL